MGAADDVGFSLSAKSPLGQGEIVAVTDDVLVAEYKPRSFLQFLYRSKPLSWLDDCTKGAPINIAVRLQYQLPVKSKARASQILTSSEVFQLESND